MGKKQKAGRDANDEWMTISILEHPYSHTGAFPPDSSKLQRRVAKNPMTAVFECAEQVQKTHESFRNELYQGLQYAYAIARHFSMDFKSFKAFYDLRFFQDGKRKFKASKQHKNALRHVMNYVFNATSGTARKRTGKYAAGLSDYMQMGMPAHIVAEQIKADGGIEKLYEISIETEAARLKRHRSPSKGPDPDFLIDDEPVHLGGKASKTPAQDWSLDGLDDDSNAQPKDMGEIEVDLEDSLQLEGADTEAGEGLVLKRGEDPNGRPTVEIEVPAKMQAWLLGLKNGERAVLRIECKGSDEGDDQDDGWVRLRAKHVFQWPAARSQLIH
ncbi:hypothetical protein [Sphingomonas sp.]|uniref:hypothetical protein n=1 Tax=Sphingomonas sp. TaxID=28214 RepID=UPI003B00ABF0